MEGVVMVIMKKEYSVTPKLLAQSMVGGRNGVCLENVWQIVQEVKYSYKINLLLKCNISQSFDIFK
jgi:hypothetical protein